MKKPLRFYLAQIVAKTALFGMRILRRNATFLPGYIAQKIDPNYLSHVEKPGMILAVTGTNGKTTVSNLLGDNLKEVGFNYMHNQAGSNTVDGIASCFVLNSTLFGGMKKTHAVLEVDERSTIRIFPHLTPNYLVVTNLFRDSYARNAHTDFIKDILNRAVPGETTMILNADDLISSSLKPDNKHITFSIPLQEGEQEDRNSRIKDLQTCPECHHPLNPEFIRYNHIGRYHCDNCGFENPKADYYVESSDLAVKAATIVDPSGQSYNFQLITSNIVDMYNVLSAATVLNQIGLSMPKLAEQSKNISIISSRFHDEQIAHLRVFSIYAKRSNPIATSRSLDFVRKQAGRKVIILLNYDYYSSEKNVENLGWIYDNDFSYLNDESIAQVVTCGRRYLDMAMCTLLAGVDEEKVTMVENPEDVVKSLRLDNVDSICFLLDENLLPKMYAMYDELRAAAKEGRI